ncbi:MAG: 2-dehydro-3-deoxygalactonokinase [Novosphingobium sp.]
MSRFTILGDWGTTRLRLWQMTDGEITGQSEGPGIGALTLSPAATLREAMVPLIAGTTPDRIVLCGMAGARNGLHEAPYAECAATAETWARECARLDFDGVPAFIAAGLAAHDSARNTHDVMRGEETQVFGALMLHPALQHGRHQLVLPGTHAKWVTIEEGQVTGLRTFITGELFALLGRSSLLATGPNSDKSGQNDGFAAGLEQAQSGGGLSGALFTARSAQLRQSRSPGWAKGYLSGLLIGHELAEIKTLPRAVTVIAAGGLSGHYLAAMTAFGVTGHALDGDACSLAGLELLNQRTLP